MASFQYEAVNAEGAVLEGRLDARDVRDAQRALKQRGLTPLAINAGGGKDRDAPARFRFWRRDNRLSAKDHIIAVSELATLVEAGVSLGEALPALAERDGDPKLADAFAEMERRLKRGQPVPEALRAGLPDLPEYVYQLTEAGAETGKLGQALRDAANQMDYEDRLRRDVRNALTYPMVLVAAGIAAVLFIFVAVVPRFAVMFAGRFHELPWLSRAVLGIGLWVNDNLPLALLAACLSVASVVATWRVRSVRQWALDTSIKIPIVGPWLVESEMARWAGMMAKLLGNRVSLMRALQMARSSLAVTGFVDQMNQVERFVRGGGALSTGLADYTRFDATSVNLVRVGERAGNLPSMLQSLAAMHDNASRDRMKRVLLLIEPAAILLIGGVIGVFITAVILAITSVNQIPI
jgi:general secretion pathway protein F